MNSEQENNRLDNLRGNWALSTDKKAITLKLKTRNFSESLQLANGIGEISERLNHHPDLAIGWGYCHVTYTTHSTGELSHLDFDCAEEIDHFIQTKEH